MGKPFVTVSFFVAALRRRRRLWLSTAAAGLLCALAFSVGFPPPYSATTTLLLSHPAGSDPLRAMATDAELLKTRTVAQRAVDRLRLRLPAKEFLSQYQYVAVTDALLRITVKAPTATEATRRANALAETFLAFRQQELERQLGVAVAALEQRRNTLSNQLTEVNHSITGFTVVAQGQQSDTAARALGDLLARRASLSDDLARARARIEVMTNDTNSVVQRSRVVDPASENERSALKNGTVNLAAGLIGGLSLGMGWVVVQEVASDRVRRREDVMEALGVPVPVSVASLEDTRWRRLESQLEEPGPELTRVVRHLRTSLSPTGRPEELALAVVSINSGKLAALAIASLAKELTKEGRNVLLADLSGAPALGRLFDVEDTKTSTLRPDGTEAELTLTFPLATREEESNRARPPERDGNRRHQPDAVLVLAELDPAVGAWHLFEWATTAVAVVTADRSTTASLRATSQMLRAADVKLTSAVLLHADPHDDSLALAESSLSLRAPDRSSLPAAQLPPSGGRTATATTDSQHSAPSVPATTTAKSNGARAVAGATAERPGRPKKKTRNKKRR